MKLSNLDNKLINQQNKLNTQRGYRLWAGLALFASFFVYRFNPIFGLLCIVAFLVAFTFLVFLTRKQSRFVNSIHVLNKINKSLKEKQTGNYRAKNLTEEIKPLYSLDDDQIAAINDLQLFDEKSLFNLINETVTTGGFVKLIELFMDSIDRESIVKRQSELKKLASNPAAIKKLQYYYSKESKTIIDTQFLATNITKEFLPKNFNTAKLLIFGSWLVCALGLALSLAGAIAIKPIAFLVIFSLASLSQLQNVSKSFSTVQSWSESLKKVMPIFKKLETNEYTQLFGEQVTNIASLQPSLQFKKVEFWSNFLSVRAHPIAHLVLNLVLPWDFFWSWRMDSWRKKHKEIIPKVLEELHIVEAYLSLSLFSAFQPVVFPSVVNELKIDINQGFHPLIDRSDVIANDFIFDGGKSMGIITGSNMSGKSTFLKAVGINHFLSQRGLPVFAKAMTTFCGPIKTCLRVSDDIDKGYSSFYAEVRRITHIVKHSQNTDAPFLYLIDEIFRGTNNNERYIGSEYVIKQLAMSDRALGFISTHDLELTQLEKDFPKVDNFHFRDDVSENQLVFSYKIKEGPCPTTNALKILRAEGLDVPTPT